MPQIFGNSFPNNTLGTTLSNPASRRVERAPDTDSRLIKITNGVTNVAPNLMHDHTRIEYIVPVSNSNVVNFSTPINTEERSLHWLTLDNSNNGFSKQFVFSSDYIFLEDPSNLNNNIYTVDPGKVIVFYGTFINGKMYFRFSVETTN
jgi:hypothetical protein